MKELVRYSEAFKLQVVHEIEERKHASCWAASEAYAIGGAMTVQRWVREYGKGHLVRKVVRVETPEERCELRKAKDRIRELEKALVDAHLDLRLERAWTQIACNMAGVEDVDTFKKKRPGMPSMCRSRTVKI